MSRVLAALVVIASCFSASPAGAQSGAGGGAAARQPARTEARPWRGWLDINILSLQSSQGAQTYTFTRTLFQETARAVTSYPKLPSAAGPGLDLGVVLADQFALGVNYVGTDYTYTVGLGVEVPHPTLFNRSATAVSTTATQLERQDRTLSISLAFIPRTPDAWRVRIFGGPTHFSVRQDMVETIHYDQVYTLSGLNLVDIDTFTEEEADGTAWGFNAGVDVAYFFSRHAGAGGIVRFNKGTVKVTDPLSVKPQDLDAGSVTVGAGLRLRF